MSGEAGSIPYHVENSFDDNVQAIRRSGRDSIGDRWRRSYDVLACQLVPNRQNRRYTQVRFSREKTVEFILSPFLLKKRGPNITIPSFWQGVVLTSSYQERFIDLSVLPD